MKVLIWGGDSWANQGDDAILAGTVAALRSVDPHVDITVASERPERTAGRHGVAVARRVGLGLLPALWRADCVLWGGGQMLQNESSKPFLWFHLGFISLALALQKPVMGYAQGAGEISGRFNRWWAGRVLDALPAVTVRDARSAERLGRLSRRPVQVTADPSFFLDEAPPEEADRALRAAGVMRPFIAIAVRRWGHYKGGWLPVRWRGWTPDDTERHHRFCDAVAAAADGAVERWGVDVLLVAMCPGGDQGDDEVAADIACRMRHGAAVRFLPAWLPAPALKAVLGRAELVVAMRTHAAMLAAGAGAPVVSLSYQGKGQALMQRLGLPGYVLPVEAADPVRLERLISLGWSTRSLIRSQTAAALPELRRLARANAGIALGMRERCASAAATAR